MKEELMQRAMALFRKTRDDLPSHLKVTVDRFFNKGPHSLGHSPTLTVIYGSIATGKTTYRRQHVASGHVALDAVEVFFALGHSPLDAFPPADPTNLNLVGRAIAHRAVRERRNLVIELVGNFPDQLDAVLTAASRLGYVPNVVMLNCSPDEAVRRNEARADHEISAYHAQPFHAAWLLSVEPDRSRPDPRSAGRSTAMPDTASVLRCLACDAPLRPLMALQLDGFPHGTPEHHHQSSTKTLSRCSRCAHGLLESHSHDCWSNEDPWDLYWYYAIDPVELDKLCRGLSACPDPLNSQCDCAVHQSLRRATDRLAGHGHDRLIPGKPSRFVYVGVSAGEDGALSLIIQ